ncbi:MAG TPA: alpha/beta fold hydrolase [Candidatus Obscuribacterales bacterium]
MSLHKIEETAVTVGEGRWQLPGIVTYPSRVRNPVAAAVLVHGSGPQDEDETIGPNKPFRDLAHGLAARGIAVLRYVKRTKQHGEQFVAETDYTWYEETEQDACIAVAVLRSQPMVDAGRTFLIGHSLGATLAPRIAGYAPALRGVIMLAPMARKLLDIMDFQFAYLREVNPENVAAIKQLEDAVAMTRKALAAGAETGRYMGAPISYWRDVMSYDPVATAAVVTKPMLIIQGARDYQVRIDIDFRAFKAGLQHKCNVDFRSYRDLNHLFISGSGKPSPAEYAVPGHVAPAVLRDIASWIKRT